MVHSANGAAVSTSEDAAVELHFGRLNEEPSFRLGAIRVVLESLSKTQRDVQVNTRELAVAPVDGALMVGGNERYVLREHAFGQLAAKLQIPAAYLRRCDPELRSRNMNRWLREVDRDLLLRVEGEEVRAMLSASYRPINHLDIMGWLGDRLSDDTRARFELTDAYLDLQVIEDQPATGTVARHDPLHRGLHLRNSEIGLARVQLSALVYRTICLNGLILGNGRWSCHRRHIGKADLIKEVRDAFDRALTVSREAVTAFSGTRGVQVVEPEKALERVVQRYELTEDEGAAVNRAFEVEPGNRLYDVINALTRAGNDMALNVESRYKLQGLGGRLTDLSATGRWIDN